jgi:septal ring factor EnvC (AmiA/AmiB activator)
MLSLDQTRLESAQLQAELGHLPSSKFPGVHAIVTDRLDFLRRHERGLVASAQSIAAGYAPPHPSEVKAKRQERITALRSAIPPLRAEMARTPVWDWQKRQQLEAAIANYESQVQKLAGEVA